MKASRILSIVTAGAIALTLTAIAPIHQKGGVAKAAESISYINQNSTGGSFSTAEPLTLGEEVTMSTAYNPGAGGMLSRDNSTSYHYYKFTLNDRGTVHFDFERDDNMQVEIYKQNDTKVPEAEIGFIYTSGNYTVGLEKGTYYVVFSSVGYNFVTARKFSTTYNKRDDFEIEFNNSKSTATPLTKDSWMYAAKMGKADYFSFDTEKGKSYKIYLNLPGHDYSYLYLIDPSGTKTLEGFSDTKSDVTGRFAVLNNAEGGTYYLYVDSPAADYSVRVTAPYVPVYRLFNPNSGEHLYTKDMNEKNTLIGRSWGKDEGVKWYSPEKKINGADPVYRVFNPRSGEHVFTKDKNEATTLINREKWKDEGICWYSEGNTKVYRVFNPKSGEHIYTADENERNVLVNTLKWTDEGVCWYGLN